jgi:uncharacterized protein YbjT (DUF2867 family)
MNVILLGATGMVGQGAMRECLLDPEVHLLQTIGRSATGTQHPKLREVVHKDLWHYGSLESQLSGFHACFFCLGVSSSGMTEENYERITYGITMAAGEILSRLNPQMIFIYVSGRGTDRSERGRSMWARVKGKTENALLRLPFKAAYMFRSGIIEPLHGIKSRTPLYKAFYTVGKPLLPLLRLAFPGQIVTTEHLGGAMLAVAKRGFPQVILESKDIRAAAKS